MPSRCLGLGFLVNIVERIAAIGQRPATRDHPFSRSSAAGEYTEDTLVEQPAIALFGDLGWETANLYNEWTGGKSSEGRETDHEARRPNRIKPKKGSQSATDRDSDASGGPRGR